MLLFLVVMVVFITYKIKGYNEAPEGEKSSNYKKMNRGK